MAKSVHLTKRAIDAFKYEGGTDYRWDRDLPSFGVRVYPSGRKSFVISYRAHGSKRFMFLGSYGTLTLDQARTIARRELGKVADGKDPATEKQKVADGQTLADLAKLYLERHASKHKSPRSAREDARIIERELMPKWRRRRIADIRRREVIALLDEIGDRPAPIMANRVRALISKLFNFAIARDLVEANPCAQVQRPGREVPRQRVLTDGELVKLWSAFADLGPIMGPLFKLRLLTLQRGAEVVSMRWSDLDLDAGWWTIPPESTKNGLAHRVPLASQAQEILHGLAEYRHENGWVFPSPIRSCQHIVNIGKAALRAKALSGVADFRPHDMRRTGASRLTGMGVPRLVVSKLLNHSEGGVTSVYDRHGYDDEKRHALETWAAYVERLITGKIGKTNVVALH